MAKFPEPPDVEVLARIPSETVTFPAGTEVSRVFFADTDYPTAWNDFRFFGPTSSRFDHHLADDSGFLLQGNGAIQDRGIMYLATGNRAAPTCLAEVFQEKRTIDRYSGLPTYVGFLLQADITLLDLTGTFVTTLGASTALHSGPRPRARRWAQQMYTAWPEIDGLLYCSSMFGNAPAIALFERGQRAIPSHNLFHRELRDAAMANVVVMTARAINYAIV